MGLHDEELASDLWTMCSRDPLFWMNTFVWTYDPRRPRGQRHLPFNTYGFQDQPILDIIMACGCIPGIVPHDLLIEKTRDMGATWICQAAHIWQFLFHEGATFLWVSRKEDLVDKSGDPKSMFWKLDYLLDNLPPFIRPAVQRIKLHCSNIGNGSTIDGESTTGDVARGDRRTSILLDEFASVETGERVLASTVDATECRIFNSTPKGTANAFYMVRQGRGTKVLRLHWSDHPLKGRKLYYDDDGLPRSPWYDAENIRRPSKLEIAQELDIDYMASGSQHFDPGVLNQIESRDVMEPLLQGELDFDAEDARPIRFVERPDGRLKLWVMFDAAGEPLKDREYVAGIDVSAGSGASNSVVSIVDTKTGQQVAELATGDLRPDELAYYAVALCRFFGGESGEAYMVWEMNGPGQIFGDTVVRTLDYRRVYYRRREEELVQKRLDKPGWFSNVQLKISLLGALRHALARQLLTVRSGMIVEEAREYVYLKDGGVGYSRASTSNATDPSGVRHNHGDRVMGIALAWKGMQELRHRRVRLPAPKPPISSFGARQAARQLARSGSGDDGERW